MAAWELVLVASAPRLTALFAGAGAVLESIPIQIEREKNPINIQYKY